MEEELVAAFRKALHTAGFIGGKPVQAFERLSPNSARWNIASALAVAQTLCASPSSRLASLAGDGVLTVANTFIATTEAITQAGAVPEFVDIDERTYNMDREKLREYLS